MKQQHKVQLTPNYNIIFRIFFAPFRTSAETFNSYFMQGK